MGHAARLRCWVLRSGLRLDLRLVCVFLCAREASVLSLTLHTDPCTDPACPLYNYVLIIESRAPPPGRARARPFARRCTVHPVPMPRPILCQMDALAHHQHLARGAGASTHAAW